MDTIEELKNALMKDINDSFGLSELYDQSSKSTQINHLNYVLVHMFKFLSPHEIRDNLSDNAMKMIQRIKKK